MFSAFECVNSRVGVDMVLLAFFGYFFWTGPQYAVARGGRLVGYGVHRRKK